MNAISIRKGNILTIRVEALGEVCEHRGEQLVWVKSLSGDSNVTRIGLSDIDRVTFTSTPEVGDIVQYREHVEHTFVCGDFQIISIDDNDIWVKNRLGAKWVTLLSMVEHVPQSLGGMDCGAGRPDPRPTQ